MRIILFSDSVGRPRPDIGPLEKTEYEETYPYLVKKHFGSQEVDIVYIESLDTQDAVFWNERMVCFRRPDVVVYHFGINDCAPRIFSKNSKSLLLSPTFRKITLDIPMRAIHKYRRSLIKFLCRGKVYTTLAQFDANWQAMLKQLKEYAPQCRAYGIGISKKPDWYEARSPGINANIDRYNNVLSQHFGSRYINPDEVTSSLPQQGLIADGIHFTKASHVRLAELVWRTIETF